MQNPLNDPEPDDDAPDDDGAQARIDASVKSDVPRIAKERAHLECDYPLPSRKAKPARTPPPALVARGQRSVAAAAAARSGPGSVWAPSRAQIYLDALARPSTRDMAAAALRKHKAAIAAEAKELCASYARTGR